MDSYNLVPQRRIFFALAAGGGAALLCYFLNSAAFQLFPAYADSYARFGAPLIEELAKGTYWMLLIASAQVGFMIDAGICAFAVGAGFSLVENLFYLQQPTTHGVGVSTLRGFGTALMHGGVACIGAMLTVFLAERLAWRGPRLFLPGLLVAFTIHSFFNQGLLSPLLSTLTMLLLMPLLIAAVFLWSEQSLRHWLGAKLDEDLDLLHQIADGELHNTRAGAYLYAIQHSFPEAIRGDMLCMLHLSLELSLRAKGDLLLREAGVELPPDPDLEAQLEELAYLERSIGRTGLLALAPLLAQTQRDIWDLRRLRQTAS
jgi:hypothetical protein